MDVAPSFQSTANPQQQEAIGHTTGPLLIIAGPGSGKTFTLVERVVFLISHHQVQPDRLLILTFTDKAAAELRTRISNRLAEMNIRFNLNEMYLGTFHSICLRLLEEFREFTRLRRNYSLMDEFDQQYFLYQRQKRFEAIENIDLLTGDPGRTSSWALSSKLLGWTNKISEEAVDPNDLTKSSRPEIKALGEACNLYHHLIQEENALDFSTIQFETLKLLREHEAIRNQLKGRFEYVMVDEYQDTNTIQELILQEITGEHPNLCVVGDDDQGLYRFRGASIRNILQFRDQFSSGCAEVTLSTNYRSHPDIIRRYDAWMGGHFWDHQGAVFRLEKTIEPRRDKTFPETATAVRVSAHSPQAWHNEVLDFINTLREKGGLSDLNQIAFLFRSVKNDKAVALADFLENSGIPVYSPRSNMFFDREEIRLMIGALIFLFPQYASLRKWHPDIDLSIWDYYDNQCVRPFLEAIKLPENQELRDWVVQLARKNQKLAQNTDYAFADLLYQLIQFPLFSRYLGDEATGDVRESRAGRNLAILSKLLSKFQYLHNVVVLQPKDVDDKVTQLFNQFFRFLKDGGINEYEDISEYAPSGCVSFLTIHQSKGLEFPVVFVGSMEAVPYKQHSDIDEILESEYYHRPPFEPIEKTKYYDFWRLYYTAFSRAQNLLVLAAETKAPGRGQRRVPSTYLEGIWNALPDWKEPVFKPELLYDAVIPKIFDSRYELREFKSEDEHEIELVKPPPAGKDFYSVRAEPEKIVRNIDSQIAEFVSKSFHLDAYFFDSNPENVLFRDLLADERVKKIYFTGMLTHGQTDFYIQYIDPDSHTVKRYYPDFLVQLEDDSWLIVEVKGDNLIEASVVQAKAAYARQLAAASQMRYSIIKGTDAGAGNYEELLVRGI